MDFYSLEITALYKHNVVHVVKKRKKDLSLLYSFLVLLALVVVGYTSSFFNDQYNGNIQSTINSFYNPINPLFNDLGKIVFTGGDVYSQYNAEKDINFIMPVNANKVKNNNTYLDIEVDENIMVMSSAEGVVLEVSEKNDEKFIVIKHTKSIVTKYENVEIIGVVPGDVVTSGQYIATSKAGHVIKFSVLKSGKPLTISKINQNIIEVVNEES